MLFIITEMTLIERRMKNFDGV
jgi:hypothetical protein